MNTIHFGKDSSLLNVYIITLCSCYDELLVVAGEKKIQKMTKNKITCGMEIGDGATFLRVHSPFITVA